MIIITVDDDRFVLDFCDEKEAWSELCEYQGWNDAEFGWDEETCQPVKIGMLIELYICNEVEVL